MKTLHEINEEIESCILEIEMHYPELYYLLEETPFNANVWGKVVTEEDLEDYLNTLKNQLHTFKKKEIKNNKNKLL